MPLYFLILFDLVLILPIILLCKERVTESKKDLLSLVTGFINIFFTKNFGVLT